jgi:Family of unknown function (DUF5519)
MRNSEIVQQTVLSWEGVTAHPHRFGGTEYRLGKREIGHIHGDRLVDIPMTKPARDQAIAEGKAEAHHILPDSGWVSIWLREPKNLDDALELLQRSFQMALAQRANRQARETNPVSQP